ncbi:MAG: hypothetical protein DRI79_14180 [Chloroflexi bacterium]|nr:MAG: hypothetical protein DRI79_14180 [Chloroflexota bacterium]
MTPLIWAIVAAVAVLVIAAVVGLSKGKGIFGVLIDGRGKYSLSRLQILLWTALIIGGYFGIAFPKLSFVTIPNEVLGLLGVSLGSTVVSTAIKANQMLTGQTADEEERTRKAAESAQNELLRLLGIEHPEILSSDEKSALLAHLSEDELAELNRQVEAKRKPSWMDLFSQEQKGREHLIDIGKLQMFTWTVAALVIYGAMLVSKLTLPSEQVQELTELPNVTGTILALMGISQAAYLGMKLPKQTPAAG